MQKAFPTDRVNNFSDAIFAIAITLLVLEIKIPTNEEIAQWGTAGVLIRRIPHFIGFLVSFLVTALYWRSHLQLFQQVKSIDNKLLWLNLWLLIFVVILPFSTALYSYHFADNVAFLFYCLNLAAIGLMTYWMTVYVIAKEDLRQTVLPIDIHWMKGRAMLAPVIFLLSIPIAFVLPTTGRFGFVAIFIVQIIGERMARRKRRAASSTVQ